MFKDYNDYKAQRTTLLDEAQTLLDEGKKDEYKAKFKAIEDLDKEYSDFAESQANINALKDKAPIKPQNFENEEGTQTMENAKSFSVESTEYKNAFFAKLQGKELSPMENTAVSASGVIPIQTLNRIIEKLEQTSVLFRYINVLHIPGNLSIPKEDTKNDASWVDMGTASTDSADTFGTVTFAAYKLIKTIEITADVQAMSIDAFESFIVNALVKKMSKAIENSILNGTGSSQPKGILKETFATTAKVSIGSTASIAYADICTLVSKLPSSYSQGAKFVMSRTMLYGTVAQIMVDGKPVFIPNANDGFAGALLGYPVIVDDYCDDKTILLGDLSAYTLNFAKEIGVELDNSVGFRTGSTCYRAMALADGKVEKLEAFVELVKA